MGRTRGLLLTLPYLACLAVPAHADEARSLPVGTLVRVTAPGVTKGRLIGTLAAANEHEIVLALPDSGPKAIPRSAVKRLEWSPGHSRHPIAGAVVGGVLGGLLGAATVAFCDAAECGISVKHVSVGAVLLALPGAGVGALIRTRDWARAEPSRVQVAVTPVRGRGVAAQLTLRF